MGRAPGREAARVCDASGAAQAHGAASARSFACVRDSALDPVAAVWRSWLPGAQRTLKRKLFEIRVAREIERKFTKDEILELYLNPMAPL